VQFAGELRRAIFCDDSGRGARPTSCVDLSWLVGLLQAPVKRVIDSWWPVTALLVMTMWRRLTWASGLICPQQCGLGPNRETAYTGLGTWSPCPYRGFAPAPHWRLPSPARPQPRVAREHASLPGNPCYLRQFLLNNGVEPSSPSFISGTPHFTTHIVTTLFSYEYVNFSHWAKIAFFVCMPETFCDPKICQKCISGRGSSVPDLAGGAHDAPQTPIVGW